MFSRPGKNVYFRASWAKFPSSRVDFPPVWDDFPYVFLYFSLQITKFPGKELPVSPIFSRPDAQLTFDKLSNRVICSSL